MKTIDRVSAITAIEKIAETDLINHNLKYCLVSKTKIPFTIHDECVRVNVISDFVDFEKLFENERLSRYRGVGISVQASKIFAIDIDKCIRDNVFSDIALEILNDFNSTYCEKSFSGDGIRILFYSDNIDDYSDKFYIKNQTKGIEFYQPLDSYRYVTITGNHIHNNKIQRVSQNKVLSFLNKHMKKTKSIKAKSKTSVENIDFDECVKRVKKLYYTNYQFQDLWFAKAPGSNSNESELDYRLICEIYENITEDKEQIRKLFEMSPYYNSKDEKHINKWKYNDNRYFEYQYSNLTRRK